jgi:hypothetical protein
MSIQALIMKIAHENTAWERKRFPVSSADHTYAEHFAVCLQAAWRRYAMGEIALSFDPRVAEITTEIDKIQHKEIMTPGDWKRVDALYAEKRTLAA